MFTFSEAVRLGRPAGEVWGWLIDFPIDCRITDWQDDRSVTMEISGGPLARVFATYAVEPMGENESLVTYSTEGELRGRFAWLTPLIPMMDRRQIRANIATLERLIENAAADGSMS